jgi:hypothetical protein
MDLDGSGEITLQEMMHVVIKNIETLEINSGDLKFEDDDDDTQKIVPIDNNSNNKSLDKKTLEPENSQLKDTKKTLQ